MNDIPQKDRIIKIVEIFYPDAKIYLFGSRVKGNFRDTSDIDISIDIGRPIPILDRARIVQMIELLDIPVRTDVSDFQRLPVELKNNILKEGVVWKK